jgi:hypothetical protein
MALQGQASSTKLLARTAEHVKQTEGSSDSTPFRYRTLESAPTHHDAAADVFLPPRIDLAFDAFRMSA